MISALSNLLIAELMNTTMVTLPLYDAMNDNCIACILTRWFTAISRMYQRRYIRTVPALHYSRADILYAWNSPLRPAKIEFWNSRTPRISRKRRFEFWYLAGLSLIWFSRRILAYSVTIV
jgi:hypothetical protein